MAMIGVLGGMGPLATVDFFAKVVQATPARGDADHVPLLIQSDPRIPSRPAAILGDGCSPLAELMIGRNRLIAAGARALVMPCNTAHFWFADLALGCPVPFISIVDACVAELAPMLKPGGSVGLIATRATLVGRIFDTPLMHAGYRVQVPDDQSMNQLVLPGIEQVKAGQPAQAGVLIEQAVQGLLQRGADAVVLACTETPVALDAVQSPLRATCVDSTAALARACVAWWMANRNVA
jgi:aspartate racemase